MLEEELDNEDDDWLGEWQVQPDVAFWDSWMSPLTLEEVQFELRRAKKFKAPGMDGLPWEFWREFEADLAPSLLHRCNDIWLKGDWGMAGGGILALLYKKDDPEEPSNWRPLQMIEVECKIVSGILAC